MERYETNVISVCLLCMDTVSTWWGLYLYNALYFGDAWLPKSKSLSWRALQKNKKQNVLHCPILILCEALALVCLQRDVSYCSLSAPALKTVRLIFRSLQLFCQSIFVKLCAKRGDTFQKSSATGPRICYSIFFLFCHWDWMHLVLLLSSHLTFDLS